MSVITENVLNNDRLQDGRMHFFYHSKTRNPWTLSIYHVGNYFVTCNLKNSKKLPSGNISLYLTKFTVIAYRRKSDERRI